MGPKRSGEIDPNGTINVANVAGTPTLDPHATTSEIVWMLCTMPLVYDQLFSVDQDGKLEGRLAENWTYSKDGLGLNFTLRDDVVFREGTRLDAAVVKTNLDRARTLDTPVVKKRMEPVTAVEVVGPYEVRLTLATPTIPYVLAECSGFIMHPDLIANGDPAIETNGSDAYSVASFTPRERLELVRDHDNYWDPDAARVETVTFQAISDKQSYVNAVVGEQVDLGNYQSYGDVAKGQDHLQVVQVPPAPAFKSCSTRRSPRSTNWRFVRQSTMRSTVCRSWRRSCRDRR
ncbi:ABC transporter substrate-binding protein [Rhodococcus artemisiae]|uniref:ABC transporter substrate-binding protein n=1 Tax=Rhodococcus artemisiae TaxID=714159 RepID=A0ABU7L6S1_9NOCA|nr:ABC transporter substrate-binding protein [Rhodococcus artemisiae]MEE2057234.1 ABC transporter substrate-binding protein [Rhodococcus artemisiae]